METKNYSEQFFSFYQYNFNHSLHRLIFLQVESLDPHFFGLNSYWLIWDGTKLKPENFARHAKSLFDIKMTICTDNEVLETRKKNSGSFSFKGRKWKEKQNRKNWTFCKIVQMKIKVRVQLVLSNDGNSSFSFYEDWTFTWIIANLDDKFMLNSGEEWGGSEAFRIRWAAELWQKLLCTRCHCAVDVLEFPLTVLRAIVYFFHSQPAWCRPPGFFLQVVQRRWYLRPKDRCYGKASRSRGRFRLDRNWMAVNRLQFLEGCKWRWW